MLICSERLQFLHDIRQNMEGERKTEKGRQKQRERDVKMNKTRQNSRVKLV